MNKINDQSAVTHHVVRRPGRYVGCEWNMPHIPSSGTLRFVLCYPDVYEIGMSHHGLQVLYHILNSISDVSAERVFAPWPDMEKSLRADNIVLQTLETRLPVRESDVLCFTIPHELCFTNILNILDLSGLPLRRNNRDNSMPLIIGGGVTAINPLPMDAFLDCFYIGEAESRLQELTRLLKKNPRSQWLRLLSSFPGMYVPDFFNPETAQHKVSKQFVLSLDSAPVPDPPLTPWCKPVHERVVVEASRGCPGQCRFCQARNYYSPVRIRSPETIKTSVAKNLEQTGYDEVSLLSLNIADYPGIETLLPDLMKKHRKNNVSISLPSLRPEKLTQSIIEQIRQVRKTGFTLAPEAGSDRLRRIIGKPFSTEKLIQSVATVFHAGWNVIKLYFMIGLPFENDDDVREINRLVRDIYNVGRKIAGRRMALHVSAAIFIPKPHTPFQWFGQASEDVLMRRRKILINGCRLSGVKLSISDFRSSRLEACFARGTRHCADIIEWAFRNGCRMDAWNELFRPDLWDDAFRKSGLEINREATRRYSFETQNLPWSFIDAGVSESLLLKSCQKAVQLNSDSASISSISVNKAFPDKQISTGKPGSSARHETAVTYVGYFQGLDDYRLFSHLEIMTGIIRAMRRAGLPLVYSQGFNPHAKVSLTQPAPLGFERWSEPIVFQLYEKLPLKQIQSMLNQQLPVQMAIHKVNQTDQQKPLRQFQYSAIALKAGKFLETLCEYIDSTAIIEQLKASDFGPVISERLTQLQMDCIFSLPSETDKEYSLKQLILICFNGQPMPLDQVSGLRIGWLKQSDSFRTVFGMESLQ